MLHFFYTPDMVINLRERSYEIYEYSNTEIPKWAEFYLSKKTSFHASSYYSSKVTDRANDILLGHPTYLR